MLELDFDLGQKAMKNRKTKVSALLIFLLCFNLSGCWFALGGAAGGGAAIYYKGWLRENTARNMHTVHEATLKAMEVKKIHVEEEIRRTDLVRIRGRYQDGINVWINIEYLAANTSRINIRVGMLGDETRSRAIWNEARRQMG